MAEASFLLWDIERISSGILFHWMDDLNISGLEKWAEALAKRVHIYIYTHTLTLPYFDQSYAVEHSSKVQALLLALCFAHCLQFEHSGKVRRWVRFKSASGNSFFVATWSSLTLCAALMSPQRAKQFCLQKTDGGRTCIEGEDLSVPMQGFPVSSCVKLSLGGKGVWFGFGLRYNIRAFCRSLQSVQRL